MIPVYRFFNEIRIWAGLWARIWFDREGSLVYDVKLDRRDSYGFLTIRKNVYD